MEEADSIWSAEGFGRHYADSHFRDLAGAQQLLTPAFSQIARKYSRAIPLRDGTGPCGDVVEFNLQHSSGHPAPESARVLRSLQICSQGGFAGAAYENLGLVCRTQYPELIPDIDRLLLALDTKMAAYFWHGVGRALYFLPTGFVPSNRSMCRVLKESQEEPPHCSGQVECHSGSSMGVYIGQHARNARIMEAFLRNCGASLPDAEAFVNGVQSALMIWCDCAGQDPILRRFCEHRPDLSGGEAANLWEWYAGRPSRRAARDYPVVEAHGRVGELFRFQSMPMWIDGLRGSSGVEIQAGIGSTSKWNKLE